MWGTTKDDSGIQFKLMDRDEAGAYAQAVNPYVPAQKILSAFPQGGYLVDLPRIQRRMQHMPKLLAPRVAPDVLTNSMRSIDIARLIRFSITDTGVRAAAHISLTYDGIVHDFTYTPEPALMAKWMDTHGAINNPQVPFYGLLSLLQTKENDSEVVLGRREAQVYNEITVERFVRPIDPAYLRAPLARSLVIAALEVQPEHLGVQPYMEGEGRATLVKGLIKEISLPPSALVSATLPRTPDSPILSALSRVRSTLGQRAAHNQRA